jgi:S1-C subfamily serine protease
MRFLLLTLTLLFTTVGLADVPENIVRIYTNADLDNAPDMWGSGVLVSPTQILTNHHVIVGRRNDPPNANTSVQIRFSNGDRTYARVVQQDKTWDMALLQIHPTSRTPVTVGNSPRCGQYITLNGFGYDYEFKSMRGQVSPIRLFPKDHPNEPDVMYIGGRRSRFGDSGGPVLDEDGVLVGILFATNSNPFDIYPRTLIIPIHRIRIVFGDNFKPTTSLPITTPQAPRGPIRPLDVRPKTKPKGTK